MTRERRMSDHDVLEELMRGSLDHCVKCTICETAVPGLERDAAVPGAEVRRPAGRALPDRRRALGRRVGRLLLGVRDLLDGPARRG